MEIRFELPEDELHVRIAGSSEGLSSLLWVFYENTRDIRTSKKGGGSGFGMLGVEQMAPAAVMIADELLKNPVPDMQTTNDAQAFKNLYVPAFLEGYRFALYLARHGIGKLLKAVPDDIDAYHSSAFIFYYNQLTGDNREDDNAAINAGVKILQDVHQQYQRSQVDGAFAETKQRVTPRHYQNIDQKALAEFWDMMQDSLVSITASGGVVVVLNQRQRTYSQQECAMLLKKGFASGTSKKRAGATLLSFHSSSVRK